MIHLKERPLGNSLAVQWLGLHASTAMAQVRSLVRELRSHKLRGVAKKTPKKQNQINHSKILQLQQIKTPKQKQNPPSFCYYCKKLGHWKRDCYTLSALGTFSPLTSLSNVLPILNDGALRNYRASSQSSLLICLEKRLSRLGMNLLQS